jgi:uncharacterized hydrophobic protein (TIGR00341 family)
MTALSSIVASVGLYQSSLVILIGSMVIAPSIGPSMALSLATSLGDLPLLHRSFLTGLAGVTITFILSVIIGSLVPLDINSAEVASRTHASFGDLTVAFMSGCAGALAFTTGVSTILIGVMVAVSLLPPLVTFGMLLGGGQISPAMGALSLFFMNMICVNLSGIITFVAQGIHPLKGKEEKIAKKAIFISSALLAFMLFTLCMLIWKLKI